MISNKARNMSSAFHINKSAQIGNDGQRDYYNSCKAANLSIQKATREQDMNHIDFIVNGKTVDVKGIKDTHRSGQILLELKNVQGKDGWCSESSAAQYISFDFGVFFLHAKTLDLVKLVRKRCNLSAKVFKIGDALYKGYSRKDRDDLMTVVSLSDVIKECEHWYLPKKEWHPPYE